MMTRKLFLLRLVVLTGAWCAALVLLSAPVLAQESSGSVVTNASMADGSAASVRFRSFNAPGGKDVVFGRADADDQSTLDWINEAAWAARNPFTITYSVASGELTVSITVLNSSKMESEGSVSTFTGVSQVGDLGQLNTLRLAVSNMAKQEQVTSAALGVENLTFNGTVLGDYVIEEGMVPQVFDFSLESADYSVGFNITGELVQTGKHSASQDANHVEIIVGYVESNHAHDSDTDAKEGENHHDSENDGTGDAEHRDGGSDDEGKDDNHPGDGLPAGDETKDGEPQLGQPDEGYVGGTPSGESGNQDGGLHGGDTEGEGSGSVNPETPVADPAAGQPAPVDQDAPSTPTAEPGKEPATPTTDPVEEPLVEQPVGEAPQTPGGFRVYLPTTMKMSTLSVQ